jgi:ribonuclease BN (tRNA processing enzyme)
MQVRVLGAHNLETSSTHHTCFLIDGALTIDAGSLVSTLGADEQAAVRNMLLTHLHFDHTRDIPTLGLATLDLPTTIEVYSLAVTLASVKHHLIDGEVYPDLTQRLNDAPPAYHFNAIDGQEVLSIGGYEIKPIPVIHSVPTVGYIVRSGDDCVAYTGDTGGGLLPFMEDAMKPRVLYVDVTFPDALEWRARASGHLTPGMLKEQIREAKTAGATLPKIVPVHRNLEHERTILRELAAVATETDVDMEPGYEGMVTG